MALRPIVIVCALWAASACSDDGSSATPDAGDPDRLADRRPLPDAIIDVEASGADTGLVDAETPDAFALGPFPAGWTWHDPWPMATGP